MLSCCRVRSTANLLRTFDQLVGKRKTVISAGSFQLRLFSTKDIFGSVDLSLAENLANIPAPPSPLPHKLTVEEIYQSGQSVVDELGLFSWWKPSGYFRYALEYLHMHFDMPWWATIMCGTCLLRLALIYVPIMSQKFIARQSQFTPELAEFRSRMQDAKRENNSLLLQQILMEQRDFLRANNIRYGRQFLVLAANGTVFMTQFFALKKMVAVNFPGFSEGGAFWFPNLIAVDPYYILPAVSALTMSAVMRIGVESGQSADQMTPFMRLGMVYGLPLGVLIMSSQFSSAICLYWCTSNFVSLFYAGLFRVSIVRNALGLPPIKKAPKMRQNSVTAAWQDYKSAKNAPPSIEKLRELDAKQFRKAGRGKPFIKVD